MKMTEKIVRSRANAQTALDAYLATEGQDMEMAISDLIADLAHLADYGEEREVEGGGNDVLARAIKHYEYEADPDHANEEV